MTVIKDNWVSNWFERHIDFRHRIIRLVGDVDDDMLDLAVTGLTALASTEGDITIILSTYGGDCYAGMGIYDFIRSLHKNHVTIYVLGKVMSMGAVILQAADTRILSPSSRMMIHIGSAWFDGHAVDFQRSAEEDRAVRTLMEDALYERIKEQHPRYTRAKLKQLIAHDTYLSAQKAVDLGLADKAGMHND